MSHNAEHESYATTEILKPRAQWIENRRAEVARTGDGNVTQMHFARKGQVTEEMLYVAGREKSTPSWCAPDRRRKADHPGKHQPSRAGADGIGVASRCKINANIGNSAVTSNVQEELNKLHTSVHYGADTMMDLSTGGDIPASARQCCGTLRCRSARCRSMRR